MASEDTWGGWIGFAAIVLVVVGSIDIIQGFVAILEDEYVVSTPKGLAIFDVTTWGWLTLLRGVLVLLAGLGLFGGASWARWVAIVGVTVNAIAQFGFMANYPQAYPLWNLAIMALNVVVLYALTARWQGYRETVRS